MALHLAGWNVVLDSDKADELAVFYEITWLDAVRGRRVYCLSEFGTKGDSNLDYHTTGG